MDAWRKIDRSICAYFSAYRFAKRFPEPVFDTYVVYWDNGRSFVFDNPVASAIFYEVLNLMGKRFLDMSARRDGIWYSLDLKGKTKRYWRLITMMEPVDEPQAGNSQ